MKQAIKVNGLLQLWRYRNIAVWSLALILCFLFLGWSTQAVWALDLSKLPQGANHQKAHAKATGKNIPIGIIEGSDDNGLGIINDANNLGTRLKEEWNFTGKTPGQTPDAIGGGSAAGAWHTTLVADIAAGDNVKYTGVAKKANVYFGGVGGVNNDAWYNSYRTATDWLNKNKGVSIFNNSFYLLNPDNDNGKNVGAVFADWFMHQKDVLIVKSAGNNGNGSPTRSSQITNPGDFYNGITVGATDETFRTRADLSSYWLQGDNGNAPDIRGKPDILAPGSDIYDGHIQYKSDNTANVYNAVTDKPHPDNDGTSFAAPHVTGVAAMLMEKGLNLPGPANRNHEAIKSIILNSARKRGINEPENGYPYANDNAGTSNQASDENYLKQVSGKWTLRNGGTPGTQPPPNPTAEWTPSKWAYDGTKFSTSLPLDDEQGTGVLDANRALIQMGGGEQSPGKVKLIGWDRDAIFSGDTSSHLYKINQTLLPGSFITSTLVWDRIIKEENTDPKLINGLVDATDTYSFDSLANLDLEIYFKDKLIAESISTVDNVEHLHIPVLEWGNPFDYAINVKYTAGMYTDFGLSWWSTPVPEPSTYLLFATGLGALLFIKRRRRRMNSSA